MVNVIAVHMESSGSRGLEHIAKLKWVETARAGQRGDPAKAQEATRAEMYDFVKNNPEQAYAISTNDDTYAFLVDVDNGHVKYVRTEPDSTTSDNLLSLERY